MKMRSLLVALILGIAGIIWFVPSIQSGLLTLFGRSSNESHAHLSEQPHSPSSAVAGEAAVPESLPALQQEINNSRRNAITRAVAQCSPAVVGINVVEVREYQIRDPFADFFNDPFFGQFFGYRSQQPQTYRQEVAGLGSGFLISSDGYVLTNDHVAGHASKIVITLTSGEKYNAKLIGTDRTSDIALLKIDDESAKGVVFPALRLANSDDIIIGEWVIAFGNPFGLFDVNAKPTVTVGVVSNSGVNMVQEGRVYRGMIQTDAAISSGNSGGPLVNALGEVVGMNTIIYSTAQSSSGAGSIGIGFAIPANRVRRIMELLKKDGSINRDFHVGLRVQQVDERIARYLDLKKVQGVVISEIAYGSAAERAGFEPGDIILEIDGIKIRREHDVLTIINDGIVGQTLTFTIQRGDRTLTKQLTLEKRRK
ncbi:MAG: trypsin-like peptidase domain-containing protein [Bacteroidota bacterium]|nr:trypsin-like peptidase domain-containing protein [Candidatus Kapabacteria bacterium]MDW8219612.1 trypsin-like peptidase domain-containing protein [Bacteroidota bacterium]